VNAVQDTLAIFASRLLQVVSNAEFTNGEWQAQIDETEQLRTELARLRHENLQLKQATATENLAPATITKAEAPVGPAPTLQPVEKADPNSSCGPSLLTLPHQTSFKLEAAAPSATKPDLSESPRCGTESMTSMSQMDIVKAEMKKRISEYNRSGTEDDGMDIDTADRGYFRFRMSQKPVFPNKDEILNKVRTALGKPAYDVSEFYTEHGVCQWLARNSWFEMITLVTIVINAIWLAVDTDYNTEHDITRMPLIFRIVDNLFCVFFTFEWTVRFIAFANKRDCLRDQWFVFDTILCALTVLETWVMWALFVLLGSSADGIDVSGLRLLRLLRLVRPARMAKVLRAMPEMVIMLKGILTATRSVVLTLFLLILVIFLYALAYRQITSGGGWEHSEKYFPTVPDAAVSLLLLGALPDYAVMVEELGQDHWTLAFIQVSFILFSSLTILNMLVGVLCEIVSTVACVEREQIAAEQMKAHLVHMMRLNDLDDDGCISKSEMAEMLMQPGTVQIMAHHRIDIIGLLELSDFIFKDSDQISFDQFFRLMLDLRGSNQSTVKDMVDTKSSS
jgi:hypothetical protein